MVCVETKVAKTTTTTTLPLPDNSLKIKVFQVNTITAIHTTAITTVSMIRYTNNREK